VTTILLIDDESAIRAPLRRILEDAGYRVVEAGGGDEALTLAGGLAGPIHLLLTDVVMPGMSGGELARRLGESRPKLKVLFMSGYSPEAIATDGSLIPGAAFLAKPFSATDLVQRVQETLAAPPPLRSRSAPSASDRPHSRK
jgi:CheY-like chemotaxis protein